MSSVNGAGPPSTGLGDGDELGDGVLDGVVDGAADAATGRPDCERKPGPSAIGSAAMTSSSSRTAWTTSRRRGLTLARAYGLKLRPTSG
jgi:hypothetical protein